MGGVVVKPFGVEIRPDGSRLHRYEARRGDIVRMYFDTGAFGASILFGIVDTAGPRAFTVVWESGIRNRLPHENGEIKPVTSADDPDLLAEALRSFARRGTAYYAPAQRDLSIASGLCTLVRGMLALGSPAHSRRDVTCCLDDHCYKTCLCRHCNPCACRCEACAAQPMTRSEEERKTGVFGPTPTPK